MIEADRDTILTATAGAPVSRDLRPNSEYYLTYPFAWSLTPAAATDARAYVEADRSRFAALSAPSTAPVVAPARGSLRRAAPRRGARAGGRAGRRARTADPGRRGRA